MIKKGNERIILTLPEKQVAWLRKMAKKAKTTPSQYIKWILCKKFEEIWKFFRYTYDDLEDIREFVIEQDIPENTMEIIKTKWIDK